MRVDDQQLIDAWVDRIRRDNPEAVAVFVVGSLVRGDAGPFSDVDFDVVVPDAPRADYPGWFDDLTLRLAAHDLAVSCPSLLHPINPGRAVTGRRAVLQAALDVRVAPPLYRADLLRCLSLTGGPTTAADLYAAAVRLAAGVIDLLESHADAYATRATAGWMDRVRDGSFRAYLDELARDG
jgi:Nucleotidyltransferase domain